MTRRRKLAVLVDDDPDVCEAVRAAGFDVLPATWMTEAPEQAATLHAAQEDEGRTQTLGGPRHSLTRWRHGRQHLSTGSGQRAEPDLCAGEP